MYVDSPLEVCPRCGKYVLLDQTLAECRREHGCSETDCPLGLHFQGRRFDDGPETQDAAREETTGNG